MKYTSTVLTLNEICSTNIGDQAIAEGLNNAIYDVFGPDTKILNFCLQRGKMHSNTIPSKNGHTGKTEPALDATFLYHLAWTLRYIFRLAFAIPKFLKTDLAIFGGGGIIMNNRLQFPTALFLCGLLLKTLRIPYAVTGVSMSGELDELSKYLFKRFLHGALQVDVRDPVSSHKMALELNVHPSEGADYAFCLPAPSDEISIDDDTFEYLLNISSSVENKAEYARWIQDFISFNSDKSVAIVTTGVESDIRLAEDIVLHHPSKHLSIFHPVTYSQYCKLATASRLVIASRLHSGILAITSKSATMILDVGFKQRGFFKAIGLPNLVIKVKHLASEGHLQMPADLDLDQIAELQKSLCVKNLKAIKLKIGS
jgi:polysaccharide pyruvyl transferase WcaK-like protein